MIKNLQITNVQATGEAFSSQKRTSSTSKMKFINLLVYSMFVGHFPLMNPDPDCESKSGNGSRAKSGFGSTALNNRYGSKPIPGLAATLQNMVATTAPDLKPVYETLQEALHRLADEEEDAAHLTAGARSAERVQQLLQRRHVRLGRQPCTKRVKNVLL